MMPWSIANPRRTSHFSVSVCGLLRSLCIQQVVVLGQCGPEGLARLKMDSFRMNTVPEAVFGHMRNYPVHRKELNVPERS